MKVADSDDKLETRRYVARMCAELRDLARRDGLGMLAYLLDMARLEAEARARDGR